MDDSSIELVKVLLSAMGGALVTLVTLRTKLALLDRENADRKRENATLRTHVDTLVAGIETRIDERLERIARRQLATLQLLFDVARKDGVDNRFSDRLLSMLADDEITSREERQS